MDGSSQETADVDLGYGDKDLKETEGLPKASVAAARPFSEGSEVGLASALRSGSKQAGLKPSFLPAVDAGDGASDRAAADGAPGEVDLAARKAYVEHVAQLVKQCQGGQDKLSSWFVSRNLPPTETPEHVDALYTGSGISDVAGRAEMVRAGIARLQQAVADKKSKKKMRDKLREAVGFAKPEEEEGLEASVWNDGAAEVAGGTEHSSGPEPAGASEGEEPPEAAWSKVGEFKTLAEAARFVMECQPFDYRPVHHTGYASGSRCGFWDAPRAHVPLARRVPESATRPLRCFLKGEPFPRFESTRDAYQRVMQMDPIPTGFISVEREFCRRLRIRKMAEADVQDGKRLSSLAAVRKRKSLGFGKNAKGARLVESVLAVQELKAWIVEASGSLFARPPSLRQLNNHAANARFFIAVSPDIERKILVEGFRVQRRCSIPCSATPKDAREAFRRREAGDRQDGSRGRPTSPRVSVLCVVIPPELGIDIVAHKSGGFLIRATELPAACFSRLKRPVEAG